MSIRNKFFIGLIFSAILPLLLVALTIFPFHKTYLINRETQLMTDASQNRVMRAEAVLRGTSTETLQQIADQYPNLGQTTEILMFLKNDQGRFVLLTTPRFQATQDFPPGMQVFLSEAMTDHEPHHAFIDDQRGNPTLMIGRRIDESDDLLVVKKDYEEVLRPYGILRDYFLVLSFIAIALAALAALMLTRTVTAPLLTLSRSVADFDTNHPPMIDIAGSDEVSSLAKSFGQMWERIKDYHRNLEVEVKKRIAESEEARRSLERANEKLAIRLADIERMNALMIGRELKMVEMKREFKKIKGEDSEK